MTKEELKHEAEEWLNKWELCNKCQNKVDCISNFSYCKKVVLQSYLASAEPREKQIAEFTEQNTSLLTSVENLNKSVQKLEKENAELKEKLEVVIALKDEEVGCVETDFNTFKSKAKEIIKYLCGMVRELNKPNVQLTNVDYSLSEAEQFISEIGK